MAYRGEIITLPVGLQGFNGSRNPSILGPGHLSYVEGVDIDSGVIIKDGGSEKLNSSALGAPSKVLAGINWTPVPGTDNDVVVLGNGDVLKDGGNGAFGTTLVNVNTPTVYPPFFMVAGGESVGSDRKLLLFSEAHQVKAVDGTGNSMSDISTPPSDWSSDFPIFGVQHANRVWAGGNPSDPHRIYYSTTTDHEDFQGSGSGSLSIYPGEGHQLVAGISFRGLLILFKYPRGVYVVDTRSSTVSEWQVQKLTVATGAVNAHCVFQISNDVLYLDNGGNFHLLSGTNDFGDIRTSSISVLSDLGPFMRSNVSLTEIRGSMGVWYPSRSKAWFAVPRIGSVDNDLRIVIDFDEIQQLGPRFLLHRRDVIKSIWMRPEADGVERPAIGDDSGFVWLMDQEERNKDDSAYDMELETSLNDFSFANPDFAPRAKNGQYLEVVADVINQTSITVTPSWDGVEEDPFVMTLGTTSAALGSFTLDTDMLSESGISVARNKLFGQGRRLKLKILNNSKDEEVRISEVRAGLTISDERVNE